MNKVRPEPIIILQDAGRTWRMLGINNKYALCMVNDDLWFCYMLSSHAPVMSLVTKEEASEWCLKRIR